jgi:REP element-mobilizing transposase RayT
MSRRRCRPQQLTFAKHGGWGGRRKGAGRPPKGERPGVSHTVRATLAARFPVHVTLRVLPSVWNLRSRRSFRVIARALFAGADRFGMRLCEFSVQGNHLHFVVEAADARALSRGIQGLSIRLAKGLNAMMDKRGRVLADRFHARILRTPTEVKHVLRNRAATATSIGQAGIRRPRANQTRTRRLFQARASPCPMRKRTC